MGFGIKDTAVGEEKRAFKPKVKELSKRNLQNYFEFESEVDSFEVLAVWLPSEEVSIAAKELEAYYTKQPGEGIATKQRDCSRLLTESKAAVGIKATNTEVLEVCTWIAFIVARS